MKKILFFALYVAGIFMFSACIPDGDNYDWVDKTDHEIDRWMLSPVNLFYTNLVPGENTVISNKPLTDAEVEAAATKTLLAAGKYYDEQFTLEGYYLYEDGSSVQKGFVCYESGQRNPSSAEGNEMPLLIPAIHLTNKGESKSYVYNRDKTSKIVCDTLKTTFRYAKENDHWLIEQTKIALNGKEVWLKGMGNVGIVIEK